MGANRRYYRVYGEAVQNAIKLSALAQYNTVLMAASTRQLIPHFCTTRRRKLAQAGAQIPHDDDEASTEPKADIELADFEVVTGDLERKQLKEAVRAILSERPLSKQNLESSTPDRASEKELKLNDTSSYGRLGSYNDAVLEQAYLAHTASQVR
jgi:RNase adaptor protein for sRNA GlmZ degradation